MADEENVRNIEYVTNFLYENNGSVYGLEVLIYSEKENLIDKLIIVNESEFDSWTTMVDNLSSAYVPFTQTDLDNIEQIRSWKEEYDNGTITWDDYQTHLGTLEWSDYKTFGGSIDKILKNEPIETINSNGEPVTEYPFNINATTLMGMASDKFSKANHTHNYASKNHSSTDDEYGLGNEDLYGHTKVINSLDAEFYQSGESLSAYQGKLLNDKMTNMENQNMWLPVQTGSEYIECKVNEYLRLVVFNYNRVNYTGLANSTGNHELHPIGTIPTEYIPSNRASCSMYRGDVVLYVTKNGSVNLYNLTKLKSISLYGQILWHY